MRPPRTAVLTGASSGIGQVLAEKLASRGVHVVLAARRKAMLDEVLEGIERRGGSGDALELDVAETDDVVKQLEATDDRLGGVDLVIANAGIGTDGHASKLTWQRAEPMLRVNVLGAIATLTALLPRMLERRRGHLVGVSSLAGLRGLPTSAVYSASKAALTTFLEGLRIDLHGSGVAVTTVLPGFVRTPMTAKAKHPMPFLLEADDACERILDGIDRKARVVEFPLPLASAVHGVAALPGGLYEAIASRVTVKR